MIIRSKAECDRLRIRTDRLLALLARVHHYFSTHDPYGGSEEKSRLVDEIDAVFGPGERQRLSYCPRPVEWSEL